MNGDLLEVDIERLVLEGVAPEDADRIKAAVERELTRLLASRDPWQARDQSDEMERVDGGQIDPFHPADIESIGRRIAQAVYGGMVK